VESDFHCFDKAISLLVIDKLTEFDTSLLDLSDAEKKQQRIQYLRNTIEPIGPGRPFTESLDSFAKSMSLLFLPLAFIFMFLPLFFFTRCQLMFKRRAVSRQLSKALAYWKIEKQELD
jgi:hypothetical protein